MNTITQLLTAEQLAEAQRMARDWKPIPPPEIASKTIPSDRVNEKSPGVSLSQPKLPASLLVREVQKGLNDLGYDAGPTDGVPGPKTWAAVRAFQADAGLPIDGKINETLLERIRKEIVAAESQKPLELVATGTGFVVSQEGHILTAFHVIRDAAEIRIPGVNSPVVLLATDPDNDLALLKASADFPKSAVFRTSSHGVRLGEGIVLVGFPLQGLLSSGPTVTSGTVSALGGVRDDKKFFQVTAPVQAGNSGGPVFDEAGQVIGMVLAKLDALKVAMVTGDIPQNVNFAIHGAVVRAFLETNGVRFETGSSRKPLAHPEMAESAQQFVLLVENWQKAARRAGR